jgi:hypothetical protein
MRRTVPLLVFTLFMTLFSESDAQVFPPLPGPVIPCPPALSSVAALTPLPCSIFAGLGLMGLPFSRLALGDDPYELAFWLEVFPLPAMPEDPDDVWTFRSVLPQTRIPWCSEQPDWFGLHGPACPAH